ncbi:hypothetical protein KI387_034987, partial [Taxus chinensis]
MISYKVNLEANLNLGTYQARKHPYQTNTIEGVHPLHTMAITILVCSALVTAVSFKTPRLKIQALPLPRSFTSLHDKLKEAFGLKRRSSSSSSRFLHELEELDIALGKLNNVLNSNSKLLIPLQLSPTNMALHDLEMALPSFEHKINQLFKLLITSRVALLNTIYSHEDYRIKSEKKWPVRGQDHTVVQALLSLDFWILFLATTCGLGSIITAIDNMGQIGKSLQYPKESISTFVSLFSIWNFLGRVGSGSISEILVQKYSIPRPLLLSLVLEIACVGHLLIAFALPGSIYVASILIGMCFGAHWPLLFSIIS